MKTSKISVPWKEGLHVRPAATIVKTAQSYQSNIWLKINGRLADAKSVLAILLLAANFGAVMDLEVNGVDEDDAYCAITQIFDVSE